MVTEWTVGPPNLWSSSLKQRLYIKYLVYPGDRVAVQKADLVISSSKFIRKWVENNYHVSPTLLYLDGINFELLDRNKATARQGLLIVSATRRKTNYTICGKNYGSQKYPHPD